MIADILIPVYASWKSWQTAEVRIGHIRTPHWSQPDGAPHRLLHAFVSCADIVSGCIPHDCETGSAPHQLLVCLIKRHVPSGTYAELVRCAESHASAVGGAATRASQVVGAERTPVAS